MPTQTWTGRKYATFYMFYYDIHVIQSDQMVIYDLNSIVNGAGGSMGLFLGVSFFGMGNKWIKWISRRRKKLCQQLRRRGAEKKAGAGCPTIYTM